MYRPSGWDNPYKDTDKLVIGSHDFDDVAGMAYEIGTDAMLESLKKEGKYIDGYLNTEVMGMILALELDSKQKGYLVFIPESEE